MRVRLVIISVLHGSMLRERIETPLENLLEKDGILQTYENGPKQHHLKVIALPRTHHNSNLPVQKCVCWGVKGSFAESVMGQEF
jgi:hypothetical protein